jgi:endoglucanase
MIKSTLSFLLLLFTVQLIAQAPGAEDARLHVDQFGYLPAAQKIAVIASPQLGYNAPANLIPDTKYRVKRCYDHLTVFEANISPWNDGAIHPQSGDKAWWFDFSSLSTNGNYYLYDSLNNLRSYPFTISDCAYEEPIRHGLRTYFYQRCGAGKAAPFAAPDWADAPACHVGNLQDNACYSIQNPVPTSAKDLHGGWHDAGDYNKYVTFTYGPLMDLLRAFEENSALWGDENNIPESGNGVPDLLDEVKYELDWLLRMQQANGAVLSVVGVQNFASASPPSADHAQRFYGPATTAASFSAASSFALAARQFQTIPGMAAYASTLQNAAVNAWNWGVANPNTTFYNAGVIAAGENQTDAYETSMRKLATACFLFALTGDNTYRTYFDNNYQSAHLMQWSYAYPFEPHTQDALLVYSSLSNGTTAVKNSIRNVYSNSIQSGNDDNLPSFLNQSDAYRAFLRSDNYTWGSNETKAHQANMFFAMNHLGLNTPNATQYKNAGTGFLHYLHGVNPTSYCFLSNMGDYGAENSIPSLYHAWFNDGTVWDDVNTSAIGPAPGYLPGGPNPNFHPDGSCNCVIAPPENQPTQKSFKAWNTGWPQNSWELSEVAIYTQAAYLRLLANVLQARNSPPSCVIDLPVEIVGNETVCADGTYNYTVIEVAGSMYLWEVVGGTIVSGQGTNSVFVLWDTSATTPSITIHQTFP